jgi:fatty acid desaturase
MNNADKKSATHGRLPIYYLSRTVICVTVLLSIGTLFVPISGVSQALIDIMIRTYLIFVGTVMAHESVHGHLGPNRATNFWWGRIALLPSMVPFTNFRRTHQLHHAHTNIPDLDPDHFMKSRNLLELALRAIAMPHHWFFWLRKRGRLKRKDLVELALNYLGIILVYSVVLAIIGPIRLFWGMVPPLILVSFLLWYPFAVQTHEGFSTGSAVSRSHNYYGRFMYWFSLGLSMHRQHHLQPKLAWIELRRYVETAPAGLAKWPFPQRDIRLEVPNI